MSSRQKKVRARTPELATRLSLEEAAPGGLCAAKLRCATARGRHCNDSYIYMHAPRFYRYALRGLDAVLGN